MTFTRRELLKCLAAGGFVTAAGLWTPGSKLISIPKAQGLDWWQNEMFRVIGNTVEYAGHEHTGIPISELHDWLVKNNPYLLKDPEHTTHHNDGPWVELSDGYRFKNPEHLTHGALMQDSGKPEWQQGGADKEIWSNMQSLSEDTIVTDKVYLSRYERPRERITTSNDGTKGFR